MDQQRLFGEITLLHDAHSRIEARLSELIDGQKGIDVSVADIRRRLGAAANVVNGGYVSGSEGEDHSHNGSKLAVHRVYREGSDYSKRTMHLDSNQKDVSISDQSDAADEEDRNLSKAFVASTLPLGWPQVLKVRAEIDDMAMPRGDEFRTSMHERNSIQVKKSKSALLRREGYSSEEVDVVTHKCIIDPGKNKFHLFWSMSSILLLIWDLTLLPYILAWDVELTGFLYIASWLTPIFWSIDIGINFFTAIYKGGDLQKNLPTIWRAYIYGWFLPDLAVVLCDWVSLVISEANKGDGSGNSGRSLKMLRFTKLGRLLRILGMMRMLRLVRVLEEFSTIYLSEGTRLGFRMMNLLTGILWVAHILACCWFGIGKEGPSDTGARWIDSFEVLVDGQTVPMIEAGPLYQYMVSFHWAAGQIALGGLDVMPSNSMERWVFVCAMMCGFLFGSTLVSMMSAAMTDYQMMQKDRNMKIRMLRQYLRENNVNPHIAVPVTKQAEQRLAQREPLDEKDVTVLQLLSSNLRNRLRYEIQKPYLSRHPIFRLWESMDATFVHRICVLAVNFMNVRPKDELFVPGSVATVAYTLVSGRLEYVQYPDSSPVQGEEQTEVHGGQWLCEAVLWVQWTHVGRCEALTPCKLLEVNASELVKGLQLDMLIRDIGFEYGCQFHKRVISACPPHSPYPTDLHVPFTDYCDLVVSMSPQVQVLIGRDAVRHISGRSAKAIEKLEGEVESSKSIVVVEGTGHIIRVVSLIVMRLTNEDDEVLTQIGKMSGSDMKGICQLPGLKQERDELVGETITRFLSQKMPALNGKLEYTGTTRENNEKESKEYGVQTRYLRSICSAQLKHGEYMNVPRCHRAVAGLATNGEGAVSSLTSLHSLHSLHMNFHLHGAEGEKDKDAGNLDAMQKHVLKALTDLDVYVIREADGNPNLYAWLAPEQFSMLSSSTMDRVLQKWIAGLSFSDTDAEESDDDDHHHDNEAQEVDDTEANDNEIDEETTIRRTAC